AKYTGHVAHLFWEELLAHSKLVTNAHLLSLERCIAGSQSSVYYKSAIYTRCGIICYMLESLGVVNVVSSSEKSSNSKENLTVYD
ncbi:MAG: hypothetical protein ACREBR_03005, partial [bacterium]